MSIIEFFSSLLNEIFNSRFLFLSSRGALARLTVKAISMTSPRATMSARLNYVKTS